MTKARARISRNQPLPLPFCNHDQGPSAWSCTKMASSSAYLPDYTSLWAEPLEPNFPRPPSPPRRGTISSHDARRAAHEQALRNVARARSVYHHSTGHHLPDRGSPLCQDPTLGFHLGLGLSWRDQVKLQEAEAGYTWNGSSVTEQEEHELSEEEEIRMTWVSEVLRNAPKEETTTHGAAK